MSIKVFNTDFYPRSPCGERPRTGLTCGGGRNISIHALLAESDEQTKALKVAAHGISIHALLAESDSGRVNNAYTDSISIHALLAESDVKLLLQLTMALLFLSTLSLRRATKQTSKTPHFTSYFYPRSPCGERP